MASPRPASPETGTGASRCRILAIDYGQRRFGLALCDPLGLTARPLAVWNRKNRRADLTRIRELCRLEGVGRVVVGWPLRLDGTPGEMAAEAARFAERLRKNLGLPVVLADERLSSWEAGQLLAETAGPGRSSRRRGKTTDDVAAAVILRDYLARDRGAA
jgi:putative Holliday junction resolvase